MSFFLTLISVVLLVSSINGGTIGPSLQAKLVEGQLLDVMIDLPSVQDIFTSPSLLSIRDKSARTEKMVSLLKERTSKDQQPFVAILTQLGLSSQRSVQNPIWISNKFEVQNADLALVELLSSVPGDFVIREPVTVKIIDVNPGQPVEVREHDAQQWGVEMISAPQAWSLTMGEGVVVGIIDTGVYPEHEALNDSYAGAWFDPYYDEPSPTDVAGHGTHCIGSTLGRTNGVGVAPGAKWIACRGLDHYGSGTIHDLLQCAQWMLDTADPRPNIVTNSWGGGQNDDFYDDALKAWIVAGIVPVFAIGNSGSYCGSTGSPGDSPYCIGVGATTISDDVARFSSRGPARAGVKPEVSAPGQNVLSCGVAGQDAYVSYSGTSMATPHVAGAVALIMSANPELEYADIKSILKDTGDHPPVSDDDIECGGTGEVWPNNAFGDSRINCLNAVQAALDMVEKV